MGRTRCPELPGLLNSFPVRNRTVVIFTAVIAICFIGFVAVKRRGVRLNSVNELVEIAMGPYGATGSLWKGLSYCGTAEGEDWFANDYGGWVTYYRVPSGWVPRDREKRFSRDETNWQQVKVNMNERSLSISVLCR